MTGKTSVRFTYLLDVVSGKPLEHRLSPPQSWNAFLNSAVLGLEQLMKWQRRRSKKQLGSHKQRTPRLLPQLEQLEERQVLAANVLADVSGTVTAGTDTELAMTVEIPDGTADTIANLAIMATAADGSTLDPAAVVVRDASGTDLTVVSSNSNVNSSTAGLTVIGLTPGDYTIGVSDEGGTSGTFQLQVSLLGDTGSSAGQVSESEERLASAALIQSLGTGNFVTELFYADLGIDLGVSQYDSGMDADGDGSLSGTEFHMIQANRGVGLVNIIMDADSGAPAITGALQNDTGSSSTDGISTDPTIAGTITDEGGIQSFTASIDGGADFDLTTLFDPNAASSFTLTQANLDQIAGGTLAAGQHTLTLTATDDLGNVNAGETITFTFLGTNTGPTGTDIADQSATEDVAFSLDASGTFSDADTGDVLTLSVGTLPSWLSFDADTATFSGTPTNADVGNSTITLTAVDSQGSSASESFVLTVANVNDAPTLTVDDRTVSQDANVSINLNDAVTDIDAGETNTITVTGLPSWLTLSNGILTGTPADGDVGSVNLTVTTTDSGNATATDTFVLTVTDVNDSPSLLGTIDDQVADEGQVFSLGVGVFFQDVDGDALTITATQSDGSALPAWLSFDSTTNILSGTPDDGDLGRVEIRVRATDPLGASISDDFLLDVGNVNDAPVGSAIATATATQDAAFTLDISGNFSDPDQGDSLTFASVLSGGGALPAWLSFNGTTGVFTGTPGNLDVGSLSIRVTATDLAGLSDSEDFTLNVDDVNAAPTVAAAVADQTLDQGEAFNLDASFVFADEDLNDSLTLAASLPFGAALPGWLTFNPTTNVFSGTPGNSDVGTFLIQLTATDQANASATDEFSITVNNINDAPTIAVQAFNVQPGAAVGTVVGTVVANDIDGDDLTFAIVSGDTATFALDAQSGEITVANSTALVENAAFTLVVSATDDGTPVLSAQANVTVNVIGNTAPIGVDDDGFTTTDEAELTIPVGDLLGNDTDPENDTLSISNVNSTSQLGASVQLLGSNIVYDPSVSTQLAAMHTGELMVDSFQYTVTDGDLTDTATVTVTVSGIDVVEFSLVTTDTDGNVISQIETGQTFQLRGFVQDIRPTNPTGVFSAYLDVTYPAGAITPVGDFDYPGEYDSGKAGSSSIAGLLDEVGAVDGLSPLGGDLFELFRHNFTAGAVPATIDFATNSAEDTVQHPVLLYGDNANLPSSQIIFGTTSIEVTGIAAALSDNGADRDPLDANDDGVVSVLDALTIVNHINGSGGPSEFLDINKDGAVSPHDVMEVMIAIDKMRSQPQAANGIRVVVPVATEFDNASDGQVGPIANDSVFASLESDEPLGSEESVQLLAISNDDLFDRWQGGDRDGQADDQETADDDSSV